jgi:hypothetical protein
MKKLKFIKSQKLLNVDNNAKTVKGQKYGYLTAILYLAPSNQSGFNVCPQASNGCKKACLYTAGHGAFDNVKQGRLNGTSDISWENTGLIEEFKSIQWYDYTKVYNRALSYVNGKLPSNYYLLYSLNEDNKKQAFDILKKGGNISAVFRKKLPNMYKGFKVINADAHDLRFLDVKNTIAGLVAKGKARKDYSGFVLDF